MKEMAQRGPLAAAVVQSVHRKGVAKLVLSGCCKFVQLNLQRFSSLIIYIQPLSRLCTPVFSGLCRKWNPKAGCLITYPHSQDVQEN